MRFGNELFDLMLTRSEIFPIFYNYMEKINDLRKHNFTAKNGDGNEVPANYKEIEEFAKAVEFEKVLLLEKLNSKCISTPAFYELVTKMIP